MNELINKNYEIETFENKEFGKIRTLAIDGEPWFVAKDVAEILGYSNTRKAISDHIDDEDKGVTKCYTLGGIQDLTVINESGLYCLVLSSKMPEAKKFRRWVTADVLPSIRKHGLYATDELIANPDLAIAAFTALKEERARNKELETQVEVQQQQIAEMQPKVNYYDLILQCKDVVPISKISKDYGMSAQMLNTLLHDKGVQYKRGDMWLLYQQYASNGYTNTKTYPFNDKYGNPHINIQTLWTQKGRLFIYELLKKDNILPLIEKRGDNA